MTKPRAESVYWSISLDVECPVCNVLFDANGTDDFSEQLGGAQVCEPVKDCSVECPHCTTEFVFDIEGGT